MARRKVDPENSLAVRCPELLKDWDYELNEYGPEEYDYMSRASVHWRCHKNPDHRWMAIIAKMTVGGMVCPGCNPGVDIVVPKNKPREGRSLAEVYPDAAKEWYQPYNGNVTPHDVSAGMSHAQYWFKCSKHGAIWKTACSDRADGKGCPMCRSEKISTKRSTLKPGDSLAEKYPELTTEWNILMNTTTPNKVFAHGRDMIHWVCKEGHQWVAPVYNRTCFGSGCPTCGTESATEKNRMPQPGHSLLEMFPVIASEFVSTEYGVTDPSMVAYSSGAVCTWHCSVCGEVIWQATVNSRTAKGKDLPGCSNCARKRIAAANTKPRNGLYLKDSAPSIAAEWDEIRNRDELGLELDDMALHSNKDAYWICPYCNESYLMQINKRTTRGDGHSSCASRKRYSFPEKAILYYIKQAFPDAEGNARPKELDGLGMKELDIWIPSERVAIEYDGQGWHHNIESELEKDTACMEKGVLLIRVREPKCDIAFRETLFTKVIERDPDAGFRSIDEAICRVMEIMKASLDINTMRDEGKIRKAMHLEFVKGSLAEAYPNVAAQWDYDGNGDLTPWMFKPHSSRKVSWVCPNGHDTYMQPITARTDRGDVCSCKTCAAERLRSPKRPKPGRSLRDLYPEIASEWIDELNDGITPDDISPRSKFVAFWRCPNHEEPYDMPVTSRANGSGCPFCSTPAKRVLPGFNDLATKHPELVDEWDKEANGDRTPYNTLPGSHYMAHWICSDPSCNNKWTAVVSSRSLGRGCPNCKIKRVSTARMMNPCAEYIQYSLF